MNVYVDRLPDSCYRCVCKDESVGVWRCSITGESIARDGRREDCPLKVIVHCKDCRWDESCCRNIRTEGRRKDDYCSYGEKQVTGKLNNPDDSLLTEDSEGVKEKESKLESEELQLSPKTSAKTSKTSTNGTYVIDGRRMNKLLYKGELINDLVYRGEAEVTDTDLISRQAAIEEIASHDPTNGTEPYFSGHEVIDILKCVPTVTHGKHTETHACDCISRQAAIEAIEEKFFAGTVADINPSWELLHDIINSLPPVENMGEVSDGYHTFNQLYHQRAVLFATIVNQHKDKAWKSWKHEDGEFCFDKEKEWFIVGVDTPEGSYTYHYKQKYWELFDCEELDRGKHWDGHTEEDVTRLLSLPPVEPEPVCEDAISRADAKGANLINRHDATTVIREECWKCNNMINDDLFMRIMSLPTSRQTDCTEFIMWLVEVVLDDEDWELNAVAYGEIIARKLKKLGLLETKDGYYIRPSAETIQGE